MSDHVRATADVASAPPVSRLRVIIAAVLLAACACVILILTLRPTPVTEGNMGGIDRVLSVAHDAGVPDTFNYHALEFTANIVMFVPFGFFLALVLPARLRWLVVLAVPAFSGALELSQSLYLEKRSGNLGDVLSNTLGGWLGLALAVVLVALIHARDRRVVSRAFFFADRG